MVGSHADEVEGGESVVRSRCEAMADAVHAALVDYRVAQEQELAELSAMQGPTVRQQMTAYESSSECCRSR